MPWRRLAYLQSNMTIDEDSEQSQTARDIEELLARVAPPETPHEALGFAPDIYEIVADLDPQKTGNVLGGLMTDPQFQAHHVRLDWALRIAASAYEVGFVLDEP